MVLSVLVKYWFIYQYHKYKAEYIELWMMKVILIRVIIEKIIINIVLKSDISPFFWDNIFL